jgi:hypothetical protein
MASGKPRRLPARAIFALTSLLDIDYTQRHSQRRLWRLGLHVALLRFLADGDRGALAELLERDASLVAARAAPLLKTATHVSPRSHRDAVARVLDRARREALPGVAARPHPHV